MFALLGALIHPQPKRALVIGLGTGMSAGWLAKVPGLDAVDVVEFEPSITTVAKALEGANQHVLDARNVTLHFGDGREWVLATNRKYDLIVSEPSNPYRSGIAALYTVEYYRAAAARLNPGGIYAQWVQGYEIDVDAVRTVARTLYGAFSTVSLWHTESSDLLFLASREPMTIDVDRVRERVTEEPFRSALTRAWLVSDVEGVLSHFILENRFVSKLAHAIGIEENTDDQNLLEYAFARKVGTRNADFSEKLLLASDALPLNRPSLTGATAGAVNWNRVAEERPRAWLISMHSTYGLPMPTLSAELRAAAVSLGCHGQTGEAYDKWTAQDDQAPRDDVERLIVAMGLTRSKDVRAQALADDLERNGYSSEAELVRRLFAVADKDPEAAMDHEEKALHHLREEAFPLCSTAQQISELTRAIVPMRPALAGRALRALLAGPFVAQTYDDSRTANARLIAEIAFDPVSCVASLGSLRARPIWDEKFLTFRLKCLSAAKDPLAAQAERDLVTFRSGTAGDFTEILME